MWQYSKYVALLHSAVRSHYLFYCDYTHTIVVKYCSRRCQAQGRPQPFEEDSWGRLHSFFCLPHLAQDTRHHHRHAWPSFAFKSHKMISTKLKMLNQLRTKGSSKNRCSQCRPAKSQIRLPPPYIHLSDNLAQNSTKKAKRVKMCKIHFWYQKGLIILKLHLNLCGYY